MMLIALSGRLQAPVADNDAAMANMILQLHHDQPLNDDLPRKVLDVACCRSNQEAIAGVIGCRS